MSADLPAFGDPVVGAQSCFRAVLDAMAHPGRVMETGVGLVAPLPLDPATAAVALTLLDGESSLWLSPRFAAVQPWIAFHCGTTPVAIEQAAFLFTPELPSLEALRRGSHEAPEEGATVVLQVRALGSGKRWRLAGPGLAEPAAFSVDGLPLDFAARWAANRREFPCGVDLILCAGATLAAVPRSVAVTET